MELIETTARDRWRLGDWRKCKCDCKGPECFVATQGSCEYRSSLPSVHKTSNALRQWFSKCVHWTSSSITGNANFQAHLRPTASGTLGVGLSVCPSASLWWFRWGLTLENPCTWTGKHSFVALGDDFSLSVTSHHQSFFFYTLCHLSVYGNTCCMPTRP